ncbi:MAG: hypothetical protein IPG17_30680 [Sandaracinaceae bacterium]|nr:hypothetical protein [Sandaracinaceae bacterium]
MIVRRTRTFIKLAYPNATIRKKGADGRIVDQPLRFPRESPGRSSV